MEKKKNVINNLFSLNLPYSVNGVSSEEGSNISVFSKQKTLSKLYSTNLTNASIYPFITKLNNLNKLDKLQKLYKIYTLKNKYSSSKNSFNLIDTYSKTNPTHNIKYITTNHTQTQLNYYLNENFTEQLSHNFLDKQLTNSQNLNIINPTLFKFQKYTSKGIIGNKLPLKTKLRTSHTSYKYPNTVG